MKTLKKLSMLCTVLIVMLLSVVVSVSADSYPESNHNYANNMDQTWTYTYPDTAVDFLHITFSTDTQVESTYDHIYIYTSENSLIGTYSGTTLAGATIVVPGNGFQIRLTSDHSANYYGFKIDSIVGGSYTDLSNCTVTLETTSMMYTGYACTPAVTVKNGDITLTQDTDYIVSYENNYEVGTAKVIVTGMGGYSGTAEKTFKIVQPYPESSHNYSNYTDYTWTYSYEDSSVGFLKITFSAETYVESGWDYIYLYTGKGTLVGKYTGSELAGATIEIPDNSFQIQLTSDGYYNYYGFKIDNIVGLKDISNCTVTLSSTTLPYTGAERKPTPTVKDGAKTLTKGLDYSVTYSNNKMAGTATVTITGMRNYSGTVTKTFTISKRAMSATTITLSSTSLSYNGSERKPTVTVKDGAKTLTKGLDYSVTYSNNKNAGTATVKITGMRNYSGTVTKTFTISKLALSKTTITLSSTTLTYDGSYRKPTPTVKYDSKTLKKDVDYTVTYSNNKNAGTATVKITGIGSCTGTVTKTFKINKLALSKASIKLSSTTMSYTGSARKPTVTVNYNGKNLTQGKDFQISYSNNKKIGTATVKIYGIGQCTGIVTKTFKIAKSITSATATLSQKFVGYNGKAQKPTVTVKDGTKTLVKGTDYTVSYENNINQGTAKVKITGKGTYTGTITKTFKIGAAYPESEHYYYGSYYNNSTTWTYKFDDSSAAYLKIKFSSNTYLKSNYDYLEIYSASGKLVGKYTGSELAGKTIYVHSTTFKIKFTTDYYYYSSRYGFKIESITGHKYTAISNCTVKLSNTSYTYNGTEKKPTVTVKDGSKTLTKDLDYKVTYSNNKNAGTATVKITGLRGYTGTISKTFTIKKLSLANASVTSIANQIYTGSAIKPSITVKYGGNTISSSNYTVTYSSNTNVGTATVTITAKGSNTSGSKKITFKILPTLSETQKNMYVGKTFTLKLDGVSASSITFSSSNTSVCTVSSAGVVTGISSGDATIYAKYSGTTYSCSVKVLAIASDSDTTTKYYQNHDDVPDFGALLKIEPTSTNTSTTDGDTFLYSLSDLQKVDPDKEAGDKYKNLLVECGFELESSSTIIDGKYYYKYVSEKKTVYFGIASKNDEVKIIVMKS